MVIKVKSWVESWQPRAKLRGSARAHWLNLSRTSGGSGGEASSTLVDTWKAAGMCAVSNRDCGFKNYQTPNRAMVDQPVNVTQMKSIVEPAWIETIGVSVSTPSSSQRPNHSWQNHCRSIHKSHGINPIITVRGGSVYESHHRSHFSVVANWFFLFIKL